ncbi:hypothetical protein E2C01_040199 [Portunus trituberculatus]|uniref:Uncharacterized protein n=1 Tax=Portunus trituberculatus TaxID=210409 RepID=A0A5B7FMN8_PORTR|nr:hypothetical protein [Portunus trituberculatus]
MIFARAISDEDPRFLSFELGVSYKSADDIVLEHLGLRKKACSIQSLYLTTEVNTMGTCFWTKRMLHVGIHANLYELRARGHHHRATRVTLTQATFQPSETNLQQQGLRVAVHVASHKNLVFTNRRKNILLQNISNYVLK